MSYPVTTSSTQTQMPSAYNSVSPRRTLGGGVQNYGHKPSLSNPSSAPKSSSSSSSSSVPQKITWSEPVREYVQRSFAQESQVQGITTDDINARLRLVIQGAVQNGELDTIDWPKYPLPQQLILSDRQQAAASAPLQVKPPSPKLHPAFSAISADRTTNNSVNKKRKSSDMEGLSDRTSTVALESPVTSRSSGNGNAFADRLTFGTDAQAKRSEKRQRKMKDHVIPQIEPSRLSGEIEKRKQRFGFDNTQDEQSLSRDESPSGDTSRGPVVGTCQDLEKRYFRLTAPPKPETVRPLPVLRRTLDFLKAKWKQENNYTYICDQLKSLRQDLTVQHIKSEFTVDVYELHARIALEKGDMGEYNQCQTQLRALYKRKLGGNPGEFLAYRILYFIYTCNRTDMNDVLADLTLADRNTPAVKHALDVRSALALSNYHRFFRLFPETPNMGAYLLDLITHRERLAALTGICKSFRPDVSLTFVSRELGFDSEEECCQFICDEGGDMLFDKTADGIRFKSAAGLAVFDAKRAEAFRRIDIKGQI